MSQENFWVLLSKKLSGNATAAELKELEELINEHPEWQFAVQNLGDLWKQQPLKDDLLAEDAYLLHLHRMGEMNISFADRLLESAITPRSSKKIWYWAAAAVLIGFAVVFGFSGNSKIVQGSKGVAAEINEVSTRPGSKSKVQLPDGSVVWLNADSKLTYTKDFGKTMREVTLTGEAFFDVTKNAEKPFVIHTSSINIKVLGTAFNVKAYPEDKQTETSLIHGSIEVTIKNRPNDKIFLSPNEKLVVENNRMAGNSDGKERSSKKIIESNNNIIPSVIVPKLAINKLKYSPVDSTIAETQWINNRLVFRDESFDDLAVRMERWYDVVIEIKSPALLEARLNGIFQSETILQALEALKISVPFHYEQTGNKIIIYR